MSEWQNRPLDPVYPVVFIDAINVKIRDGNVANRPIYVALGVTVDGHPRRARAVGRRARRRGGIWNEHRFVSADSCCCLRFSHRLACR